MISFMNSFFLSYLAISAVLSISFAYPGRAVFKNAPAYVSSNYRRQTAAGDGNNDGSDTPVLIGDLRNAPPTTPTGTTISNILLGFEDGQSNIGHHSIGLFLDSVLTYATTCLLTEDTCCVWYQVSLQLTRDFLGPTLRCNDLARSAIRLGFHDAGTWSQVLADAGQDFGGADGSFILFNEITRTENNGLQGIDAYTRRLHAIFPSVSYADLIQYMAIHATVTCPLGPRIRFFAGRNDAIQPSPTGLLPSVSAPANVLVQMFHDKTIPPHDLAALLGAHSCSRQFHVDESPNNVTHPQDSTPGVWDVRFYNETLQDTPVPGTFRFASDKVLSLDPRLNNEWQAFVGDQNHWNEDFARAYIRLSLLGVNNINQLTECTQTLPPSRPSFAGSSDPFVDQ